MFAGLAATAKSLAAAEEFSTKELLWVAAGFAKANFAAAAAFFAAAAQCLVNR